MIDLQAEADRLALTDWETFVGLVETIEEQHDDFTPKLILADWIDEKELREWNGESMRWAAANDKHPYWGSWPNKNLKIWRFEGTKQNSLPPVFYDGPPKTGPSFDLSTSGPAPAWLWFVVRWTQLFEQGITF